MCLPTGSPNPAGTTVDGGLPPLRAGEIAPSLGPRGDRGWVFDGPNAPTVLLAYRGP